MNEPFTATELKRAAERICALILTDDYPRIDIEIEQAQLKRRVRERMPEKLELYEMVYESRFRRLWDQWRRESPRR
jgi:hypothetical protein